ncbi:MAG: methyltransferase domain-containing protein, partial [Candidatus Omnitrophota bacterium]
VYGLSIAQGKIEETAFPDEHFDIITFWHVLDALADPNVSLQKVYRMLKRGGQLWIRVNNFRFVYWSYRLWRCYPFHDDRKESPIVFHGYNFTASTLRRILTGAGFQDIRIRNSPPPPGVPYPSAWDFSKKAVQLQKGLVHGVSELCYFASFGTFFCGSTLLAESRKSA